MGEQQNVKSGEVAEDDDHAALISASLDSAGNSCKRTQTKLNKT